MRNKDRAEYTNKKKGIAVELKFKNYSDTVCGYRKDPETKIEFEIANPKEVREQENQVLEVIAKEIDEPRLKSNPAALKLAFKHDKRLQYYDKKQAAKGRNKKWNMIRSACLWFDVECCMRRNTRLSVEGACSYLSKKPLWEKYKAGSLETAYYDHALNSPMTKDFKKLIERKGWTLSEKAIKVLLSPDIREEKLKNWRMIQ